MSITLNLARHGERILITRDGEPVAVMMGLDDWERLAPAEARVALARLEEDTAKPQPDGIERKTKNRIEGDERIGGWGLPDLGRRRSNPNGDIH